jgi:hypothetical protein
MFPTTLLPILLAGFSHALPDGRGTLGQPNAKRREDKTPHSLRPEHIVGVTLLGLAVVTGVALIVWHVRKKRKSAGAGLS